MATCITPRPMVLLQKEHAKLPASPSQGHFFPGWFGGYCVVLASSLEVVLWGQSLIEVKFLKAPPGIWQVSSKESSISIKFIQFWKKKKQLEALKLSLWNLWSKCTSFFKIKSWISRFLFDSDFGLPPNLEAQSRIESCHCKSLISSLIRPDSYPRPAVQLQLVKKIYGNVYFIKWTEAWKIEYLICPLSPSPFKKTGYINSYFPIS